MRKKILVTGANGQVGEELHKLAKSYTSFEFIFATRKRLALDNPAKIGEYIYNNKPDYLINCAAYTAVDKAESEEELAYTINAEAPKEMAIACEANNIQLVHVSTDYVFDGKGNSPYKEDDITDPVNLYGDSKLEGEKNIRQHNPSAIIIRTAWVYSEFGKNFVKTMLRLMAEKDQVNVVSDQRGAPTYAADLAEAIMNIISKVEISGHQTPGYGGIYHFSNEGNISWYDFAVAIKELTGSNCIVNPIPTSQFPTPAKRPFYSVLDKTKIQNRFGIEIKDWKQSLTICIDRIKQKR
ncbi:dTDP-4-dehydrorhamnose reductase [Terrimonas alba]|uniref:dTDP-4-dehydrorhamnose reductase n=1 Tax=Terrimonas alba TaxID=3349636 RepID=UPI0035F3827E